MKRNEVKETMSRLTYNVTLLSHLGCVFISALQKKTASTACHSKCKFLHLCSSSRADQSFGWKLKSALSYRKSIKTILLSLGYQPRLSSVLRGFPKGKHCMGTLYLCEMRGRGK